MASSWTKEVAIFLLAVLHSSECLSLSVADDHYNVAISTTPQEGPFLVGTRVTFQCHVDSPPLDKSLSFIWRTASHYLEASECATTYIPIPLDHPRYGRYFCLAVMDDTIVGVASTAIEVRGLPYGVGPSNLMLSTGDSAKLRVEGAPGFVYPEYTVIGIFEYTWYHNGFEVMNKTNNEGRIEISSQDEGRSLCINSYSQSLAGTYEARITRLGFGQYFCTYNRSDYEVIADSCSNKTLQAIENYGILAPATFHISSLSSEEDKLPKAAIEERFTYSKMFFEESASISVNATTRLSAIEGIDLRTTTLVHRWLFNGSEIYECSLSTQSYLPENIGSLTITDDNIVSTQFQLTEPGRPQDFGIYELQVFLAIEAVQGLCEMCTCCDYYRLLTTSDGAGIDNNILLGSATIEVALYGPPQVRITAGSLALKKGDSTQLNCTVLERNVDSDSWITLERNGEVLSVHRGYNYMTSLSTSDYGTYTCVALNRFGTSEAQVHLAEKVVLQMQLFLDSPESCTEPQVSFAVVEETLLQQLVATLAIVCKCSITSQNIPNSSLVCSEMSNSIIFTAELVYSSPDGSLTASSLVKLTREWIKGVRTINESNLQLDTQCSIQLPMEDVLSPGGCETSETMEETMEYELLALLGAGIAGGVLAGMLCAGLTVVCFFRMREKRREKKHAPADINRGIQNPTPDITRNEANNQLPLTPNLAYGRLRIAAVRPGSAATLTSAATLYDYPEFRQHGIINEESTHSSGYEN